MNEITEAIEEKARAIHMEHMGDGVFTLERIKDLVRAEVLFFIGRIRVVKRIKH